jgi:hypothetical protein
VDFFIKQLYQLPIARGDQDAVEVVIGHTQASVPSMSDVKIVGAILRAL